MLKAILFDVDGVLIDSLDANYQFYKTLLTTAGYKPPTKKEYPRYFHNSLYKNAEIFSDGSKKETERVFKLGEQIEYPFDIINLHRGAEKAVKELSKKYKLGIVTSRLQDRFFKIPGLEKLQKLFSVVVAFEDTRNHKPHPEPLLLACKKLKIKPREAVYVGDAETDILAGKAAGMKTILYLKKRLWNPDLHTASLTKLSSLAASL
jgi:HAD superfamily hydrolase (TIGR01662 family)